MYAELLRDEQFWFKENGIKKWRTYQKGAVVQIVDVHFGHYLLTINGLFKWLDATFVELLGD